MLWNVMKFEFCYFKDRSPDYHSSNSYSRLLRFVSNELSFFQLAGQDMLKILLIQTLNHTGPRIEP